MKLGWSSIKNYFLSGDGKNGACNRPVPPSAPDLVSFHKMVKQALGEEPKSDLPSRPVYCGETVADAVTLNEYKYENGFGETVGLTVAEPSERKWQHPVIAVHQTNDCGRKEVFGQAGDPALGYGLSLAKRGHRVFATDLFLTGDRNPEQPWNNGPFYKKYPNWSMLGKMLMDLKDVTYLIRNEFGEGSGIHCIGHSMGGIIGYFFPALYPEITRVVCNAAYFETAKDGNPWNTQLYTNRALNDSVPGICIAQYTDLLISLASVRSEVLLICYKGDTIISNPIPTEGEIRRMKTYSDRSNIIILEGGHTFPHDVQDASYKFLETGIFKLPGVKVI